MRRFLQWLALALFLLYLAVFPGSTITVALDRVPAWGEWMGNALLLVQGASVLCWLLGNYGRRGALVALSVFTLAWGAEHIGVTTGRPFGSYRYTEALQPQLLGVVPLAIPFAWLMVAVGAWQLATIADHRPPTTDHRPPTADGERRRGGEGETAKSPISNLQSPSSILHPRWPVVVIAATLVLLLDMQIETVATAINRYWAWLDSGPYYAVPTANFVAWWVVGGALALVVARGLGREQRTENKEQRTKNKMSQSIDDGLRNTQHATRNTQHATRFTQHVSRNTQHATRFTQHVSRIQALIPATLYLLSTAMFSVVNLARGYSVAGLIGVMMLVVAALMAGRARRAPAAGRVARQISD